MFETHLPFTPLQPAVRDNGAPPSMTGSSGFAGNRAGLSGVGGSLLNPATAPIALSARVMNEGHHPLPSGERSPIEAGDRPDLGNFAKSVDTLQDGRARRYRLQAIAAKLLPQERGAHCHRTPTSGVDCRSVIVIVASTEAAAFRGLQTCGSVWLCPICAAKVSNARRKELNELLAWARGRRLYPILLSLTMSHTVRQGLSRALGMLKGAKKRLHQSRSWRSLSKHLAGHVTATEVNKSRSHGWHPHYHCILLVRAMSEVEAMELVEDCREPWLAALKAEGGRCNTHGFQIQGAATAGDYIGKWGAAEELTLAGAKQGRADKGWTPWQLLAMAEAGDKDAASAFREYARVFKGRRQLTWSRGLKAAARINEASDDDLAAAEEEQAARPELAEIACIERPIWRAILRAELRAEVLNAAPKGYAAIAAVLVSTGITEGLRPAGWRGVSFTFPLAGLRKAEQSISTSPANGALQ